MRIRKLTSLLLAATMAISIAACGKSGTQTSTSGSAAGTTAATSKATSAPDKVVEVSYITAGAGGLWEESTKKVIEQFHASQSKIRIKYETYSYNQVLELLQARLSSGDKSLDVIGVDSPLVAAYASRGFILPMDKYFTAQEKAEYIDSAIESASFKGKFYCPPVNTSSLCLLYNKSYLDKAGIPHPSADPANRMTFEDLYTLAAKAQKAVDPDKTKGIEGLAFQQVGRFYQIQPLMASAGGKFIGSDGLTVDGIINSEPWVKALSWYKNLYDTGVGFRGSKPEEQVNNFLSGKSIFLVGSVSIPSQAVNSKPPFTDFGFAPHPYFKGGVAATPTGSWHYGISAFSQKPDEAAEFIKYISVGKGIELFFELTNYPPSVKRVLDGIAKNSKFKEFPFNVMNIAAYEAAKTAVPRPSTLIYSEYESIINSKLEDIRNGADVKKSLDAAVTEINAVAKKLK